MTEVKTMNNNTIANLSNLSSGPDNDTIWHAPERLDPAIENPEQYPADALSGDIGNAVRQYQFFGQQPLALVAQSFLSTVSLACQVHADIGRTARNIIITAMLTYCARQ
jgi:hypothetical protein